MMIHLKRLLAGVALAVPALLLYGILSLVKHLFGPEGLLVSIIVIFSMVILYVVGMMALSD